MRAVLQIYASGALALVLSAGLPLIARADDGGAYPPPGYSNAMGMGMEGVGPGPGYSACCNQNSMYGTPVNGPMNMNGGTLGGGTCCGAGGNFGNIGATIYNGNGNTFAPGPVVTMPAAQNGAQYSPPCSCTPPQPAPVYSYSAPHRVTLKQIPYTGIDFGIVGDVMYWLGLIAFALASAYLILYYNGGLRTLIRAARGSLSAARR